MNTTSINTFLQVSLLNNLRASSVCSCAAGTGWAHGQCQGNLQWWPRGSRNVTPVQNISCPELWPGTSRALTLPCCVTLESFLQPSALLSPFQKYPWLQTNVVFVN